MGLSDLTSAAVISAVEEFDRVGRESFLRTYGFRKERGYPLIIDGRYYDSKAIAGAAHGYLPGQSPLSWNDFSGGNATVRRTLSKLGFTVARPEIDALPAVGEVLTNSEISSRFSVGISGGMRRSKKLNCLVLISDPFKGLYQDRWEEEVLHYTGMGPIGPQTLSYAQNRTLAESPTTGISVHLFEALDPKKYTYVGEMQLFETPYQELQPDDEGQLRNVWMFPITLKSSAVKPLLTGAQARAIESYQERRVRKLSVDQLKKLAQKGKGKAATRVVKSTGYLRNVAIAELAKRLANGNCDLCASPAPFQNRDKEPYLESHHIIWLAKGGDDSIENTVALCPNCHRKMHILDALADREKLLQRSAERDTALETLPDAVGVRASVPAAVPVTPS